MADLSNILGGPWSPPATPYIAPPEVQLRDAIISAGLEPPAEIVMDGKIHRFRSGSKGAPGHGDKPGWYLIFGDGIPSGRFGCWRAGLEASFRADVGRAFTPSEEIAHAHRMTEAKAVRDAERARSHEVAANTVEKIWTECQAAHPDHPYLVRKGISAHGARITGDGRLIVPLYDADGVLASLQYIDHLGEKRYHPGAATGGMFCMIGTSDEPGTIYIAEGFATAATIHEATGRPCVAAYSASSLVPVTAAVREKHGAVQDIVIVADNDDHGVGQRYADQASAKYGARVIMPPVSGMDANDYAQAGNSLMELLRPVDSVPWLIPADVFSAQPAPIAWLVKGWIQQDALIMVHGPSGGGKTFVLLDWCLRMAASVPDWMGSKVKPASIVYLAGEGHHGLRGRIAAWKHHNSQPNLKMWLSRSGCDLNTREGYLQVVTHIRAMGTIPDAIVVDTLHRFLSGDENSSQDAKTMLDACAALMAEFGCSVILVHHTGVSEEAQHRARGSSAWRGALDIEISIVPSKDGRPLEIVQRKSKDAELAQTRYAVLQSVAIPGWFDEDGEPVTSAVVVQADAPVSGAEAKVDRKMGEHRQSFEDAWFSQGAETRDGLPYICKSALVEHLVKNKGISEASARQYVKPSAPGKMVSDLITGGIIMQREYGWVVCDPVHVTAMTLRKASR